MERKTDFESSNMDSMAVNHTGDKEDVSIAEQNGIGTSLTDENFQIIGSVKRVKSQRVNPTLPKWMSESSKFDGDLQSNCSDLRQFNLSIDEKLLANLEKTGIDKLFPVQKTVIPCLIESFRWLKYGQPRDLCVLSPTGSGKTLAYAIPIVNYLLTRVVTQIRALIIMPVSDLAIQVYKVFQMLCKDTTLRVGLATSSGRRGASDVSNFFRKNLDESGYVCSIDILIATTGKLIDLIQQDNGFNLNHLQILVIDEADRMMNETQFQWLREIENSVFDSGTKKLCACSSEDYAKFGQTNHIDMLAPCSVSFSAIPRKSLHKLLFSATLNTDPEKINHLGLHNPMLFNVFNENESAIFSSQDPKQTIPASLKELMIITDKDKKPLIVWHLLKNLGYRKMLCFTDSVSSTHRLFQLMQNLPQIVVSEFSSRQNSKKRSKILHKFESGAVDIIISTDIFARGLDVNGISCVICYDPPRNETAYIHRIGRTARAGSEGTAISLITPDELRHFTTIARRAHKGEKKPIDRLTIKESDLKPLVPLYKEALKVLENDVNQEVKAGYLKKRKQIFRSTSSKLNGKQHE